MTELLTSPCTEFSLKQSAGIFYCGVCRAGMKMANRKGVLISGLRTFSHREEKLTDNSLDATLTDMREVDGRQS